MSADIDTPALVIDESIVLKNIKAFQAHCDAHDLQLRPHIKTHKLKNFMQLQMASGASGITCQKISEAEVMVDGGATDVLITYNIIGRKKLARLKKLFKRTAKLSVVLDSQDVLTGLSSEFTDSSAPLSVLVECDTGALRCGVMSEQEAVQLAIQIEKCPGLRFAGLMTYPKNGAAEDAETFMGRAIALLQEVGIDCPIVSTGGTPDMWKAHGHTVFTEYRAGTYIYNDRSLIESGTCAEENCAARINATVVSRPAKDRLVIDSGSKVLTSDLSGGKFVDYGYIVGHPEASIYSLSEEHGVVQVPETCELSVGDRVEIIPNHVCVISNMLDFVLLKSSTGKLVKQTVDARGTVL